MDYKWNCCTFLFSCCNLRSDDRLDATPLCIIHLLQSFVWDNECYEYTITLIITSSAMKYTAVSIGVIHYGLHTGSFLLFIGLSKRATGVIHKSYRVRKFFLFLLSKWPRGLFTHNDLYVCVQERRTGLCRTQRLASGSCAGTLAEVIPGSRTKTPTDFQICCSGMCMLLRWANGKYSFFPFIIKVYTPPPLCGTTIRYCQCRNTYTT